MSLVLACGTMSDQSLDLVGANIDVVGRRRETELVLAALEAACHIVLECPPGTGKSTLLRAVAAQASLGFVFVEGNAELTPTRLVGHFDPAQVMARGYDPEVFIDGPLVSALRDGALLYVEEINRVPEETLNLLITVMSEGELMVPRLGLIKAHEKFRLVAAMNPFDSVGTARISGAIYDRVCRLVMDYQSSGEEAEIVASTHPDADPDFVASVIRVVRATRDHPELRMGSSVRGALDLVAISERLAALRSRPAADPAVGLDAALVALSGRVHPVDSSARPVEELITELWWAEFDPPLAPDPNGDQGKVRVPRT